MFEGYGETLESPNVVYIGDLGQGKSSAMKTWGVLRQLILGRRIVVIDKKYQIDRRGGEYTPLAEVLGVVPTRFRIGYDVPGRASVTRAGVPCATASSHRARTSARYTPRPRAHSVTAPAIRKTPRSE